MTLIQIILIALITFLLFGMGVALVLNQQAQKTKRIRGVIQGHSGGTSKSNDKNVKDKRRADLAKKLKDSKEDEIAQKKKATISMMIEQAGMTISVAQFWIFSMISMLIFVSLSYIMGHGPPVLVAAAIIGLLGFPRFVLKKKAARRQKKFLEEFPDALEATVRLLKAGMPVGEAIAMIAREYDGPVGEEMELIYDKQKIGVPLHEAALEGTRRIPLAEMQMFATGLSIQAQTGSSLSEVLMNLSGVIRARFRLKRKVKALSSEAVASASIIGALPILVATGMYFVNYDYISIMFTDPTGKFWLGVAVFWMCCGILVMKQMINFKI